MADTNATAMGLEVRPTLDDAALKTLAGAVGDDAAGFTRRLAARTRFHGAATPDRVLHLWRFTNPAQLLPLTLEPARRDESGFAGVSEPIAGAAATIDLWPGVPPMVAFADALAPGTVALIPAGEGAAEAHGLFAALNETAWNAGIGLAVADGARLSGPIHIRIHARGAAVLPRITLKVGRDAEAMLIEHHLGGGPDVRVGSRTEITTAPGAVVRHAVIQTWEPGTCGHLSVLCRGARAANLLTVFGTFGGEKCKTELETELAGEGAHSEMIGVAVAGGQQHFDLHTRHRHLADRTTSRIDFKAVAADRARSTYTGLIRIEDEARHCEAFQENRNLLLSPHARADAIPELEIHNQEVSCSHGATIAPVDRDQLFYLASRGLDPSEALGLVVRGFLENTLTRLSTDMQATVEAFVGPRLAAIREGKA